MFYFYNLEEAYNFIKNYGGYYSYEFINQKPNETPEVYRSRLFKIASRIHACLETYPKEIYTYYTEHPNLPSYSLSELTEMTYYELSTLRKSLGIKKTRQSAKKVIKSTSAEETYSVGLSTIAKTPTSTLASQIIIDNEREESREESILSIEEIATMYGYDNLPSLQELRAIGIVPEFPYEYEKNLQFKHY